MRKWLLTLLGGADTDYVLMRSLIDRNEFLERRHRKVTESMSLVDGLLSAEEYDMAQAQLRHALIAHRLTKH